MEVGYAISHGVIDQANGQYVGRDMNGEEQRIPISDAIKKGLVFAEAAPLRAIDAAPVGPRFIQETQTCTIKAVVDPITQQEIAVSQAIKRGEPRRPLVVVLFIHSSIHSFIHSFVHSFS